MNLGLLSFNNVINRTLLVNISKTALFCRQSASLSVFVHKRSVCGGDSYVFSDNKFSNVLSHTIWRGKKHVVTREPDSSDDDDNEKEKNKNDLDENKDSKIITAMVTSMRADGVYKAVQKSSRSKIDTMFFEGRLRVNGKLLLKKSQHINLGDEMDIIKGLNSQNSDFLNISRIDILKLSADVDHIALTARFYKNLLVENYLDNPWSPEMNIKEEAGEKKSK